MNAEQFIKALIELDTDSMSPFEAFTELLRLRREARSVVMPRPICTIDAQDFESEADYDAALAKWESEHSAGSK